MGGLRPPKLPASLGAAKTPPDGLCFEAHCLGTLVGDHGLRWFGTMVWDLGFGPRCEEILRLWENQIYVSFLLCFGTLTGDFGPSFGAWRGGGFGPGKRRVFAQGAGVRLCEPALRFTGFRVECCKTEIENRGPRRTVIVCKPSARVMQIFDTKNAHKHTQRSYATV